jgi:hypothetical protein
VPTWNQNTTGTAGNVTGTVAIGNGGTGATSAAGARSNLGLVIGTDVLSPSGSAAGLTSFPTLNQNTTGTAGNVTGTVAIGNGGTGSTTASGARSNLGLVIGTDVLSPSGSAAGLTSFPTLNQNTTGSSGSCTGNSATATALTTASGSAPSYSARAWVNFNGTGTIAIRGSANVSSITDNDVGDFTVNFTTAMSDANYAFAGVASPAADLNSFLTMPVGGIYTASALQVLSRGATNLAAVDASIVTIIVLR